jgi:RNA polymerase sigma-70 factor (ECF subfamily)
MIQPRHFPETRLSLLSRLRHESDAGHAHGWREFFERYAPAVYRVALHRGLSPSDADDIVQQTMLAVSAHIGDFRYERDRGKFRQWVTAVAGNKIVDLRRSRLTREGSCKHVSIDACGGEVEDDRALWQREWEMQDLCFFLDRIRDEISPRRYEAFDMYVLQGVSAKETARAMGMTPNHVYVTRTLVIQRIRKLMEELDTASEEGPPLAAPEA